MLLSIHCRIGLCLEIYWLCGLMLVNNLLVLFLSLSVEMTASWQVLVGIAFIIFASWLCITGVNFLCFGVFSCLDWYAGMLVNSSLILSNLFKKKSAMSSASWLSVVPVSNEFSFLFTSMPFNSLNSCFKSLLAPFIIDVFCCSLAFYCICFIPW